MKLFSEVWYFVTKIDLTYCEKNCSTDQEKLFKFEAVGQEFEKNLGSLEQFIKTERSDYSTHQTRSCEIVLRGMVFCY